MTIIEKSKNTKYEYVAPDGGWGYAVGIGFIINRIVFNSFIYCFGMLYKDIFIELNMDSTSITLLNGVGAGCLSLAAFFTSPLLNFLSIRQLGMLAALIYNSGAIGMVFVNSKLTFFIYYGVLQSLGKGVLFNLALTVLNDYFVKKRLFALSLTQTILAMATFVMPQFLKWSLKTYGIRGTILLLAGISLNNIFGTLLMQPVAWHMKKVEVPENKEGELEIKLLLAEENRIAKIENPSLEIKNADPTISEKYILEDGAFKNTLPIKKKLSGLVNFKLPRSFPLSNAFLGMGICVFTEYMYILMLPQALYSMGWDEVIFKVIYPNPIISYPIFGNNVHAVPKLYHIITLEIIIRLFAILRLLAIFTITEMVAWALSLNAMGDLATTILLIFISKWLLNFGSSEIYVTGLVIAFITRIGMLCSENIISMMTFIALMGVSRCTIMLLISMVQADSVKPEHFTIAMGHHIAIVGISSVTIGPIIEAVRDLTDSYATVFFIMASCIGIVIMFWSIELLYKKNKHKRQPK